MWNLTEDIFEVLHQVRRPDLTVHMQLLEDERERLKALATKVADGNFNQADVIEEAKRPRGQEALLNTQSAKIFRRRS